jgi:hypothetical protein
MKTRTEKLKDYCDAIIADEFPCVSEEEQSRIADVFFQITFGDGKWLNNLNEYLRNL